METYYITYNKQDYPVHISSVKRDNLFEVSFIGKRIPGEWMYDDESNLLVRTDLETETTLEVRKKIIVAEDKDKTPLVLLREFFDSQIEIRNSKEYWSKVPYAEYFNEEAEEKVLIVESHGIAFYFDNQERFKGMGGIL